MLQLGALPRRLHADAALLVPQVQFSQDGNFLYTGARQDGNILCWDIRNTGDVLYAMQRDTRSTNQRVQFSIEPGGRHLATGEMCSRSVGCAVGVMIFDCNCIELIR
jgi:telomerase Cajal body protein 1